MRFLSTVKSVASNLLPKNRSQIPQNQGRAFPADFQDAKPSTQLLPPLNVVPLPCVLPKHQFALSDQGWTKITHSTPIDNDRLYACSQELFKASDAFFDLPLAEKQAFKTQEGSEDGWSHVGGEKELLTLRTLQNTPQELREVASAYWTVAGTLLNEMLGQIAESLGLSAEGLNVYSMPCMELGQEKTATMLRLFRYEGSTERKPKIVAEAHRDLGLLSLVIGDTPGLEVWDRHNNAYFPIEKSFTSPAGTVLVGRQLERLTNSRYRSGGHLVRSYPNIVTKQASKFPTSAPRYRYSVVFVLRAHSPVPVDSNALTTNITGQFQSPLDNITAGQLYREIQRAHFNVNIPKEERDRQKKNLAGKKLEVLPSVTS